MKIALSAVCVLAMLATSSRIASADDDDEGVKAGPRITLDPTIAIPLGDLADTAGFGFGASVAFRLPLNANVGISARTGFLYHLPKNDVTTLFLPLMGGVSYGFKPAVTTPYIAAEFGLAYGRASGDGLPETNSGTKFAGTFGGGYRVSFGDLRAGLQVQDFGNFGSTLGLFVTAAFRIAKF